jgi:hypothetical protein
MVVKITFNFSALDIILHVHFIQIESIDAGSPPHRHQHRIEDFLRFNQGFLIFIHNFYPFILCLLETDR